MNEYLKNLNRIEFVVTWACTGRCRHCSEGEHTLGGEPIDGDAAVRAIYEVCEHYQIESLMTFGGEPLLYPEIVCQIHKAAKKMNIQRRDLITNGFFSRDEKRIQEVVDMLAESGVGNVALSVDAFHQERIPLEPVRYFAECVQKTDMMLRTSPAWLVSKEDDNSYNVKTREILQIFTQMGIETAPGNVIFPSGNAVKYLGEYFDETKEYVSPYEEDPKDVRTISFSPNGDVLNGNIGKNSIMDVIAAYSAD